MESLKLTDNTENNTENSGLKDKDSILLKYKE